MKYCCPWRIPWLSLLHYLNSAAIPGKRISFKKLSRNVIKGNSEVRMMHREIISTNLSSKLYLKKKL